MADRFARRMRLRAEELERGVTRLVQTVSIAVDQALVLSTPVDTGRARSNWIVSTGQPTSEVIPPYAPGENLGTGEGANANAALEQGRQEAENYRLGQTLFITNNLPYIGRLNDGSSAQAPAMFVEEAIQEGVRAVEGADLFDD